MSMPDFRRNGRAAGAVPSSGTALVCYHVRHFPPSSLSDLADNLLLNVSSIFECKRYLTWA